MEAFWIVISIAAAIAIIVLAQKLSKEKEKTKLLTEEKTKQTKLEEEKLFELRTEAEELNEEIENLQNRKSWIEEKTIEAQATFESNEKMRQNAYLENEQRRKELINSLETQIAEKNNALEKLKQNCDSLNAQQQSIRAINDETLLENERLRQETILLQQQHSNATKRQVDDQDCGKTLSYSNNDLRLIDLLDKVKKDYPDLAKEIAEIEWKKVWQPAFKQMTNDSEFSKPICGIYRIYTIDDKGFCRNYIGQAVDIRERWSEHIKKMIGVKPAGNEFLYKKVSPQNAHFEIVEKTSTLNEREHYWIAFYNAATDGYNIKL